MGPSVKDYLRALAREMLPAFRRGVIVVTGAAYVLFVATYLILGWHLSLSTLQLWTGALGIAALEVIVVLPYRLWKANMVRIAELENELSDTGAGPDWTIRELFYHIRPDDLTDRDIYERVGLQVLDKLATGELSAWGRRARGRPLQLITMLFWANASFTYWFLAEGHDEEEHARLHDLLVADESYRDIRVNRALALRFWPKKRQPTTTRDRAG
jgi:hypothetical protein